MFSKILIANRGEIACRIIATAKKMGIKSVAVYSEADAQALHVSLADEAYCIGPAAAAESYLNISNIIGIALKTNSQAIHPGYGFLSENSEFCLACEKNNIVFVGPSVAAIQAMGSKAQAKIIMEEANVPLIPGCQGSDQSAKTLKQEAEKIAYPLLIKASAGGGGKGMRLVENKNQFDEALTSAKREAKQSFGDDKVILEKYLSRSRHVEVQIFCDDKGNGVYLGDRDCSMQRRHQKILEEAPAPGLSNDLRKTMGEAAVRAALAINYCGAGTIEFLLDQDSNFYFMEMNTRLQVEHPVTECVTGIDLVEWQMQVAAGEELPLTQTEVSNTGHAIEARIYAEDPNNNFMPSSGRISYLQWPSIVSQVRIDKGVRQGDTISSHYDPMLAKLIVHGKDREHALQLLDRALGQTFIAGIDTNLPFLTALQNSDAFRQPNLSTSFVDDNLSRFQNKINGDEFSFALAALALVLQQKGKRRLSDKEKNSPWNVSDAWRLNLPSNQSICLLQNDQKFIATVEHQQAGYRIEINKSHYEVNGELEGNMLKWQNGEVSGNCALVFDKDGVIIFKENIPVRYLYFNYQVESEKTSSSQTDVISPMHGHLLDFLVKVGDEVKEGDGVAVIEAMKMEHTLRSPINGKVKEISYQKGELVENGAIVVALTPLELP